MNNKGKATTTILFLIPVFVVISLIVFDTLYSFICVKTLKNDTETIINEVVDNNELFYDDYPNEIKRLYENKGYSTDMLVIDSNSYEIHVEQEYYYYGLLSSLKGNIGEEKIVEILGVPFKVYKNSKTIISVTAKYDDGEVEFDYSK